MTVRVRAASILEIAASLPWTKLASARNTKDEVVHWLDRKAYSFDAGTAMMVATKELGLPLFDKGLILAMDTFRDYINGHHKDRKPDERCSIVKWNDTIGSETVFRNVCSRLAVNLRLG